MESTRVMNRTIASLALFFLLLVASPVLAQQEDADFVRRLLSPSVLVFLVPITGIIVGGAIAITHAVIRHRERIAMIQHGIHPDSPEAKVSREGERARSE